VQRALAEFKGVGRRFQRYGEVATPEAGAGHFTVIDDYGHHPVEMAATLAAARGAFPGRRLVLAFQPHRYSRTRDCFEDFVKVIGQGCDACCCPRCTPQAKRPSWRPTAVRWPGRLRVAGKVEPVFVDQIADMPQAVMNNARDGDVLICMGAGSIGAIPAQVVALGGHAKMRPKR
jgi:UDP-N-acetylmuramate--alanine ligase